MRFVFVTQYFGKNIAKTLAIYYNIINGGGYLLMTEEQKKFKILKKESYEQQISKLDKEKTTVTFLMGLSAAAALCAFPLVAQFADSPIASVCAGIGSIYATASAHRLKELMEAISKKTMLQGKIEDINNELEMPENEESRGMRR